MKIIFHRSFWKIAALVGACVFTQSIATGVFAQSTAQSAEFQQDRTPAGTLYSLDVPNKMVTPWDDTGLSTWLETYASDLENAYPELNDSSLAPVSFREINGQPTYYYQSTREAVDPAFDAADEDVANRAMYVLARNCALFDPWACYNLAMVMMSRPTLYTFPADVRFQLLRRAADADYTLATHWLIRHERAIPRLWSVDDAETYLRRTRDVDGDFAFIQLVIQLADFYAINYPNRDDDGYYRRAIAILNDYGESAYAVWLL